MKGKRLVFIISVILLTIGSAVVYAQARCYPCSGNGIISCAPCRGSGAVRTGTVRTPDNKTQPTYSICITCRGSGIFTCNSCQGIGKR